MSDSSNVILDHETINHKIRRIAYQIYETNVDEDEIILAGIAQNGYILAKMIKRQLAEISGKEITLCKVMIDKRHPLSEVKTSLKPSEYSNKSVVLVDDVLNSGTTLVYGVKHFLNEPMKKFKTAVLVNRNHKKYPVKADFKGLSLSTTIKEHIAVNLEKRPYHAILE